MRRTQSRPELLIWHDLFLFGSPMCVDTVPPVALEDMTALWADARWLSLELLVAAKTGLLQLPSRRWRASRSRARSPWMHHASYPVLVHRPAALDWASSSPRLTTTHLPSSLPSALRSGVRRTAGAARPGHRTRTYEVTRHARRTRLSSPAGDRRRSRLANVRWSEGLSGYICTLLPRRHECTHGLKKSATIRLATSV